MLISYYIPLFFHIFIYFLSVSLFSFLQLFWLFVIKPPHWKNVWSILLPPPLSTALLRPIHFQFSSLYPFFPVHYISNLHSCWLRVQFCWICVFRITNREPNVAWGCEFAQRVITGLIEFEFVFKTQEYQPPSPSNPPNRVTCSVTMSGEVTRFPKPFSHLNSSTKLKTIWWT